MLRPPQWQTRSVFFFRSGRTWFSSGRVHMLELKAKLNNNFDTILVSSMGCFGIVWWRWINLEMVEAIINLKIQIRNACAMTASFWFTKQLREVTGKQRVIHAMRYLLFSTCAFGDLSFRRFRYICNQSPQVLKINETQNFNNYFVEQTHVHPQWKVFKHSWFFPFNTFWLFCALSLLVFAYTMQQFYCLANGK